MKGAAILAWALLIFTFLVIFMFTTVFVYRYRITIGINNAYNYDNAQLALLTFLSSTYDGEQMSKILAEHVSVGRTVDVTIIKDRLDKIIDNKCYSLKFSDLMINGTNIGCVKKYAAVYKLSYPYNPKNMTGDVSLVIG